MQIYIKTLTGKTIAVVAEASDTIENVEVRLNRLMKMETHFMAFDNALLDSGYQFPHQRLVFADKLLDLSDYKIQPHSTIHLAKPDCVRRSERAERRIERAECCTAILRRVRAREPEEEDARSKRVRVHVGSTSVSVRATDTMLQVMKEVLDITGIAPDEQGFVSFGRSSS